MEKTNAFRGLNSELRKLMGLQDGESLLASIEAMKKERDEARGELAERDEQLGVSIADRDILEAERDRLAATVAAVREHCMDGTFDSCDDDHQIGQNDALEAVLKVLDSPVSAVRVTYTEDASGRMDFWKPDGQHASDGLDYGDTLLLVKVRDHE